MKYIYIRTGLMLLAVLAGLTSCKREMGLKDPAVAPGTASAFISLIDVAPNLDSVLQADADTFNVLFNGVKVTGYTAGTSPVMTFGSVYPLAGTFTGYASVPAGAQQIQFARGINNLDSVLLASFHETLTPGQHYSLIITDSINSGRDSSRMFIKDSLLPVTQGFYNMRFINTCWSDTGNVDIWSTRNNRTIFSNIKPGQITGFSSLASNWQLSDTLFVRRAGTMVGLDTLNTQTYYNLRSYTLVYKGHPLSNAKTDAKRRHIIAYVNN
jgi:hypothetical protein